MVSHLDDVTARVPQGQVEVLAGTVAVETAAVGVRLPSHRPSCHVAVAGNLRVVGSREQTLALRALVEGADLCQGVERHQVREVTVPRVGERIVLPFREAELPAVGLGPQSAVEVVVEVLYGCYFGGCEGRVFAQHLVSLHHVVEHLVARLLCKGRHVYRAVLRAEFAFYLVASVGILRGGGLDEKCVLVHDRQGTAQEVAVHRILIVAPKVRTVPGSERLHRAVAPGRRAAEDVVLHGHGPSPGSALYLRCQLVPRGVAARCAQVEYVVQEGQVHLREVGRVGRPVVHLHVDVGMYVAMPEGRVAAVVPDALQVGWRVDCGVEVRSDGEVAAVLEVERLEEEAVAALAVLLGGVVELDKILGGHRRSPAQLQVHTVHQTLVQRHVFGQEVDVSLADGVVDARRDGGCQAGCRCSAHASGLGGVVVRSRSHEDVGPRGATHVDALVRDAQRTVGHHAELRVVAHYLQFAAEGCRGRSVALCRIGHTTGVDLSVGGIADAQGKRLGAFRFVVRHKDAVGGRGKVAAAEVRLMVGRLEVDACHAVDDVEVTAVVLNGLVVVCFRREGVALVLHQDGTEVLEVALPHGAAVRSIAAPEGLLVELYVVAEDAAANGGSQLAVPQRKGILHPRVGNARGRGRRVVPKREVVDVGRTRAFLPSAELGWQYVGFGHEEEDVAPFAARPQANLLAGTRAAPLVEVAVDLRCRTVPRDFVHTGIVRVGRLLDGESLGICVEPCLQAAAVVIGTSAGALVHQLELPGLAHEFPKLACLAVPASLRRDALRSAHVLQHEAGIGKCHVEVVVVLPVRAEDVVGDALNRKDEA